MKRLKITKRGFLLGFIVVTLVLAVVKRIAFNGNDVGSDIGNGNNDTNADVAAVDSQLPSVDPMLSSADSQYSPLDSVAPTLADEQKHPIYGVHSYKEEFPDTNDLQLTAAERWGVPPVANRRDAEQRKQELVYVGSNPYYEVRYLSSSIPYLVPRAAVLLQDIGRNFFDSLHVKHIPLHRIMVSSVLRTKEDVEKLRRHNRNATEKSCHLYGTTFDISHTKFLTVSNPDEAPRRQVRDDTLKFVLSEVLRDLRNQNRCFIKYEVKQSCFHITVR